MEDEMEEVGNKPINHAGVPISCASGVCRREGAASPLSFLQEGYGTLP